MAEVYLQGNIHNSESVGTFDKRDALGVSGNASNAISVLMGGSIAKHKAYRLIADPAAYEKNALVITKEANELLIDELAKNK